MKKLFFYTPFIATIADNGSERFGATAKTMLWEEGGIKAELTVNGKTKKEAERKFWKSLESDNFELVELPTAFFFCSAEVVKKMKPAIVSAPLRWDKDYVFVAMLNFEECETFFQSLSEEYSGPEFWLRECVPGSMDVSEITIRKARSKGLFNVIKKSLDLTQTNNLAMIIRNVADREGISPVELFNKIDK